MSHQVANLLQSFSRADIARHVGCTRQAIGYWFQGRTRMPVHAAQKLAELAGVPVQSIVEAHLADYNGARGHADEF